MNHFLFLILTTFFQIVEANVLWDLRSNHLSTLTNMSRIPSYHFILCKMKKCALEAFTTHPCLAVCSPIPALLPAPHSLRSDPGCTARVSKYCKTTWTAIRYVCHQCKYLRHRHENWGMYWSSLKIVLTWWIHHLSINLMLNQRLATLVGLVRKVHAWILMLCASWLPSFAVSVSCAARCTFLYGLITLKQPSESAAKKLTDQSFWTGKWKLATVWLQAVSLFSRFGSS